jgi:hypothetical protein
MVERSLAASGAGVRLGFLCFIQSLVYHRLVLAWVNLPGPIVPSSSSKSCTNPHQIPFGPGKKASTRHLHVTVRCLSLYDFWIPVAMLDCFGALLAAPPSRPIFLIVLDELCLVFLFPPILFLCAGLHFVSRESLSNLKTSWRK